MAALVDVCRFTASSSGTGDFVVASAVTGYQTPAAAGALNGATYRYRAESADLSQWEVGYGAYTSGSTTLARTTVLYNSSGTTSKISFSAAPQVAITALSRDLQAPYGLVNHSLAVSAAGSALTIALKDSNGSDPSESSPVVGYFRNVTGTVGSWTQRQVTAANSLVISSGSTMGVTSSTAFRIWVVLFDDGGTMRLGAINCSDSTQIYPLSEGIESSTAEGGAGAADSSGVIYTGTAVTSKAYLIVGYIEWSSSGLTAGTWTTTNVNLVQSFGSGIKKPGDTIQTARTVSSAKATGTTQIPNDGTIPQNTEGDQYMSRAITPKSAANLLLVNAQGWFANTAAAGATTTAALFQDSVANAITVAQTRQTITNGVTAPIVLDWMMRAGTASSTTFKVRAGTNTAVTTTFNGENNVDSYGANMFNSFIQIEEIQG